MTSTATRSATTARISRRNVATVLLSWLAMVGVDLFLHAGLLAPLYDWNSPFLLPPEEAFVRIPAGYLGFLILTIALAWLLHRFNVERARDGAMIAGVFGAITWAALLFGLWSISTADPKLLAGWWIGQTAELVLGGLVIGSVLGGTRPRAVASRVGILLVVAATSAIVLQAVGYASAPVVVR